MRETLAWQLNKTLIERFDAWLLVQRYAVLTKSRYLATARKFAEFLGDRSAISTTHSDVQQYLGVCAKQGQSIHLLNIELYGLRAFFDFLCLGGLVKWVPPRLVRMRYPGPRVPRFLRQLDVKKLFGAARTLQERMVCELLYGTGCRPGELSSMRIEDLDFVERRVRVRGKGTPRFLMLTPRLIKLLRKYIGTRCSGYVLVDGRPLQTIRVHSTPYGGWDCLYRRYDEKGKNLGVVRRHLPVGTCNTANGAKAEIRRRFSEDRIERPIGLRPVSIASIERTVQRIALRVGMRVTPRLLRHSIATHLLDNGADVRVVSACLGHKQLRTTMVYVHISQKRAQASFEKCHPMK